MEIKKDLLWECKTNNIFGPDNQWRLKKDLWQEFQIRNMNFWPDEKFHFLTKSSLKI